MPRSSYPTRTTLPALLLSAGTACLLAIRAASPCPDRPVALVFPPWTDAEAMLRAFAEAAPEWRLAGPPVTSGPLAVLRVAHLGAGSDAALDALRRAARPWLMLGVPRAGCLAPPSTSSEKAS